MRLFGFVCWLICVGLVSANVDQNSAAIDSSKSIDSQVQSASSVNTAIAGPATNGASSSSGLNAASAGPESRQILAGNGLQTNSLSSNAANSFNNYPFNTYASGPFVASLNANPNSMSGSFPGQAGAASSSGSGGSLLNMLRPQQNGGRRSSLTNRLKNFMSSLFWNKDTAASSPYLASGSSYSFAYKQPPFGFQSGANAFAPPSSSGNSPLSSFGNFASASAYRPVVFPAYGGSSSSSLSNGGSIDSYGASSNVGPSYKPQYGNGGISNSGFGAQLGSGPGNYWANNGGNGVSQGSSISSGNLAPAGSASFASGPTGSGSFGSFSAPASFGSASLNSQPLNSLGSLGLNNYQAAASSHSNVYSPPSNGFSTGSNGSSNNANSQSTSSHSQDNGNQYQRSGNGPSSFKPVSNAAIFSASAPIGNSNSGNSNSASSASSSFISNQATGGSNQVASKPNF